MRSQANARSGKSGCAPIRQANGNHGSEAWECAAVEDPMPLRSLEPKALLAAGRHHGDDRRNTDRSGIARMFGTPNRPRRIATCCADIIGASRLSACLPFWNQRQGSISASHWSASSNDWNVRQKPRSLTVRFICMRNKAEGMTIALRVIG